MPESDLDLLIEAAKTSGEIALGFWRRDPQVWDKGQNDPVSEADLAVDAHLKDVLLGARPDYGWLSEETPDSTNRLDKDRVFVVDPIDGTRSFVDGQETWAHSIAVVERGQVVAGLVFLPARDWLYTAELGAGAFKNGARITVSSRPELAGATILANKAAFDPQYWTTAPDDLKRSFRPSLAYRLAACAEGKADGMITFRDAWEWDIAAGALIASEAGARVTDRNDAALVFNARHPKTKGVMAASPALHTALMRRRRAP